MRRAPALRRRVGEILSFSGAAEAAGAPVGFGQFGDFRQRDFREFADHHLRDAVARVDGKNIAPEIEQDHFDFTAIVRIYRAGRIGHSDVVFRRPAAAGTDLRLVSRQQFHCETGGDDRAGQRFEFDIHAGTQVVTRIIAMRLDRQESFTTGHKFDFDLRHGFLHFALSSSIRFCSKYSIRRFRSYGANDPPSYGLGFSASAFALRSHSSQSFI